MFARVSGTSSSRCVCRLHNDTPPLNADNQTDEGLEKDGTSMSQIPTYVTGVPNGTEKVARL